MTNKVAVITGASRGIGKEFAILFAQKHYDLILLAKNEERVKQVAAALEKDYDIKTHIISKDLAVPGAPYEVYQQIEALGWSVDVLINNAGYGINNAFHDMDINDIQGMVGVNITALTELTRYFLPGMVERKSGHILNMASTSAYQPGPLMAIYFASKAFVLSLTEALHEELKGTGVSITALCPGPTKSAFADTAHLKSSPIHNGTVPMWTAKDVAQQGVDALFKGRRVHIVGWVNAVLSQISRLTPNALVMRTLKKLHTM